jgi:L-lactate dehydrogenase complex protein LldE
VDQVTPRVGVDAVRVLRRIGVDLYFPEDQTCCGQPAFNSGHWDDARPCAERFVRVFGAAEMVVCPSGSCTTMVRSFYPELLQGHRLYDDAVQLGKRVYEFTEFLVDVAKVTEVGAEFPHVVTYHAACHATRELGVVTQPRELLRKVRALELRELSHIEECCGFGGTFSTKFAMISAAMGETKAGDIESTGAEFVTSVDSSCLLHLDGILRKKNSRVQTVHVASILASVAPAGVREGSAL